YRDLELIAHDLGAVNLNEALLDELAELGQLEDVFDLEGIGEQDAVQGRLEEAFERILVARAAGQQRVAFCGLETLVHFNANLRRIRDYAVNSRPIALLLPGDVQEERARFYGEKLIDCEFDILWEVIS